MNTEIMSHDHFLMLDDQTKDSPGEWPEVCGSKCILHKMTVKSDTAQKVWVTLHTWDERNFPQQCKRERKTEHYVGPDKEGIWHTFKTGAK